MNGAADVNGGPERASYVLARRRSGGRDAVVLLGALVAVLVGTLILQPSSLVAQELPARWGAAVVGGVHGTNPELHLFGGLEARARVTGRVGITGLAVRGSGRSYTSSLLALGPSFRLPLGADAGGQGLALEGWAGPAWYGETLEAPGSTGGGQSSGTSGIARSGLAALAGVALRIPVWRGTMSMGLVHWRGSVSADDFAAPGTFSGTRFLVGVGR